MILVFLFLISACSFGRSEAYEIVSEVTERWPDTQNIQLSQGQVLPPYGVRVTAEKATLILRISTSQRDTIDRMEDIQQAMNHITVLADENDAVSLVGIAVNQVSGSYASEESSTRNIQNLDTSGITLKLTSELSRYDYDFIQCIAEFNEFLNAIDLPDTIHTQAVSIEADLGDLEGYRSQIIAEVYRELNAVQDEYGQSVTFEISGLYDPLKKMQLSDSEYYLYLEPMIIALEF